MIDDETDMKALESNVRSIEMDGLVWGASKLVPLAFGIKKLQVTLVVEDEKVSVDELQSKIEADEDHVQSTDVVSFSFEDFKDWATNKLILPGCYAKALDLSIHLIGFTMTF